MGIQTIGTQSNGQHLAPATMARQGSWYSLTLGEVETQLEKPLGSMNLDELLRSVWVAESVSGSSSSPAASLQRQASLTLARALSGKTVEEVWGEILQGQRRRRRRRGNGVDVEEEEFLGEVTLEDFLVKAGLFADPAPQLGVSSISSPSVGAASDATTSSGRKRGGGGDAGGGVQETSLERRLRRKIKNRESAARSRARKQAYHNELVGKVTQLEEEILKLKKEQEVDEKLFPTETLPGPRYQLRRTSSASF